MEELKEHAEVSHADSIVAAPIARSLYGLLAAIGLPLVLLFGGVLWYRHGSGEQVTNAAGAKEAAEAAHAATPAPPGVVVASETHLKQITVEPVVTRTLNAEREATGRVGFNEDRVTPVFTP